MLFNYAHTWLVLDFGGQYLDTDPVFLDNIDTFVVPILTYVLVETNIKGVNSTTSERYMVLWIGFILRVIMVKEILLLQKASKLGFFVK